MPYRIDLPNLPESACDALIDLGALDVEHGPGGVAALLPDSVPAEVVAVRVGARDFHISEAAGRDDGSVWRLTARPLRVGTLLVIPAGTSSAPGTLIVADNPIFGTGLHPTTRLCVEAIEEIVGDSPPSRMLDVGTGSGILALVALRRGVGMVVGIDVDPEALRVTAANAQANQLGGRLALICGSADAVRGQWPLVVANIRAADLIEIAPLLVPRVAAGGSLVLSGIARGLSAEVSASYRHFGMTQIEMQERAGWTALVMRAAW